MSTPHIEHFVDERGNFIYRAEFEGSFLSKDEVKELAKHVSGILDENAKLRELVRAMWLYDYAGKFSSAQDDVEHVAMVYRCMRELGVEI